MFRKLFIQSIVILLNLLIWTSAQAIPYNQIGRMYFFGDSLTDSGFNDLWPTIANPPTFPPLPPGKAPTFTTFGGYIWSQYIMRDIKGFVLPVYPGPVPPDTLSNNSCCVVPGFSSGTLLGANYASAGSTTNGPGLTETWAPSLKTQVQTFLTTPGQVIYPNDLIFIWEGANDILTTLLTTPDQLSLLTTANVASTNIADQVELLAQHGAKRFVVISLPNIGRSPLISGFGIPELVQQMKNLSFTFDSMLNQQLGRVISRYHVQILYVDVYSLLDKVINSSNAGVPFYVQGQPFLFTNTTTAACGVGVPAVYCTTGSDGHIFADFLHPTDMAHRLIAMDIEAEIMNWNP